MNRPNKSNDSTLLPNAEQCGSVSEQTYVTFKGQISGKAKEK